MISTQVFVGSERPSPERMSPIDNGRSFQRVMSPFGGIWTSTRLQKGGKVYSDWLRYREQEDEPLMSSESVYLLHPLDNPAVYTIRERQDLETLVETYEREAFGNDRSLHPSDTIDFEEMSNDG